MSTYNICDLYMCTLIFIHTQTHTNTRTHARVEMHTNTHIVCTYTRTLSDTHTHTLRHTHTHTRMHTHTHTQVDRAKVLSNTIKQKRKEKAGKWEVPLPKVRPVAEQEMFK